MANVRRADQKRLYSWWWDSHISPKNSKWLKENLTDMDSKVKAMIKLLEEDADSFAKRAEMYYKKRPELMKLVEEFYRAYRALAERYDHATGVLRQAQRTMSEAFPNQIPMGFLDESPHGSLGNEVEPHTPETTPRFHAPIDPDGLQNDALDQFSQESDKIQSLQQEISLMSIKNQNMENLIREESQRATKAENELHLLNATLSEFKSKKDSDILEYQEKISNLEKQLFNTQNDLKKLNDEMSIKVNKLQDAEELDQSLQTRFDVLEKRLNIQENELNEKQGELEKLLVTLEDKHQQYILLELAHVSKEKLLLQSQEEIKLLSIEIEKHVANLKDMEVQNMGLQDEICNISEDNKRLNDHNIHLNQVLQDLDSGIVLLKEKINKLHDGVELHVAEKEIRNGEVYLVKEDSSNLEPRHQDLKGKINVVSKSYDSLLASHKKLEDENSELKEIYKRHETDRETLSKKLESLETVLEKNVILENSLSVANGALEDIRVKNAMLENLQESLNSEISLCIHEKEAFASRVEILTQNLEKFTEDKSSLEKALSKVNAEFKHVSSKLKDFEETCKSLEDTKSSLFAEKEVLISQVKSLTVELQSKEVVLRELQEKNTNLSTDNTEALHQVAMITRELEGEKSTIAKLKDDILELSTENNLVTNQFSKLQDVMKLEKQEHIALVQSYESHLATLKSQIELLQETNLSNQRDIELEQNNLTVALMEIFILQQSLFDLCERNTFLYLEGENHLEAFRSVEKLALQHEQEKHMQTRNIALLSDSNEKLRKGFHLLKNTLIIEKEPSIGEIQDEVLINVTMHKIQRLMGLVSEAETNCQQKHLEISILFTFIRQMGLDVVNMKSDYYSLEKMLETKTEKLSTSESKIHELTEFNEQLIKDVKASIEREELLKLQMNIETYFLFSIVNQTRLDVANLVSEKCHLENDVRIKDEELIASEKQQHELVGTTEQLMNKIEAGNVREELLEQRMSIELSVLLTILKQFGFDLRNLESAKRTLEFEFDVKTKELLGLQDKKRELIGLNNQLKDDLEASIYREKVLKEQTSIEISVLLTLIKQSELDIGNLRLEKFYLEKELGTKTNEFLVLTDEKHALLVMNEQLVKDAGSSNLRVELMKQQMSVEMSVIATFIKQLEVDIANLKSEKYYLQRELDIRTEELLSSRNKIHELLDLSEKLIKDVEAGNLEKEGLNQQLNLEISVLVATINKLALDIAEVNLEKRSLGQELQIKTEDLLASRNNVHNLLCLSEQLTKDVKAGNQREELLEQQMNLELLVLSTLLKQMVVDINNLRQEKVQFEEELQVSCQKVLELEDMRHELIGQNEKLISDVETKNIREENLKTELRDIQALLQASKSEISNLTEDKKRTTGELCNMKQKYNALEAEISDILAESMKLDHLYEFFKCLNSERLLELKSFRSNIDSLCFIKSVLDSQIHELNGKIGVLESEKKDLIENVIYHEGEFRNRLLMLEFDLTMATCISEELNNQSEIIKNQLITKEKELSEASQKFESALARNKELCLLLESHQLENEAVKLLKEDLEKKLGSVSEALSLSKEEIGSLSIANQLLKTEMGKIQETNDQLISKEKHLISELQKEIDKVAHCEEDIEALLTSNHVANVYTALYEEKVCELLVEREISSLVQKEITDMECALTNKHVDELHKKLEALEIENREFKANIDAYLSLVTTLEKAISVLGEHIKSMSKDKSTNHLPEEGAALLSHQNCRLSDEHQSVDAARVLLERLTRKVEALQKMMEGFRSELGQDSSFFNDGINVKTKETEGWKQTEVTGKEQVLETTNSVAHVYGDHELMISNGTNERNRGLSVNDINLGQVSSSSMRNVESYAVQASNSEIDDHLWEAAERESNNGLTNGLSSTNKQGMEILEKQKSEESSRKLVAVKEVSNNKLEAPKTVSSSQKDWSQKVIRGLHSDAQKLSELKEIIEELKVKMGSSHTKFPANLGFDTLKTQLKATEGGVTESIDINKKLIKNADSYFSSEGKDTKPEENGDSEIRQQISEQARRESSKVGRLELELQKIQYVLLKLEEEYENRQYKATQQRGRVLLRDYLYGKKDNEKYKNKSLFCGCMRPRTNGDD